MALTKPRASQIYDIDYKQATRVITVANINLSGGAPSQVDGVNLSIDDRVLVIGQSTGSQNGIYFVDVVGSGSDGTWIRSTDSNSTGELLAGTIIMVTEGLVYHDTQWKLTTNNPIVIGTTALTFEQNSAFAFGNVYANSTAVLATSVGDVLTLAAGNNISIVGNNTSKLVTIGVTGANAFGNILVTGETTVSADSASDSLTLAGGSGIEITTDSANSTVTIASTGQVSIFAIGGSMGSVTDSVTTSQDLGLLTDVATIFYNLETIIVNGPVYPSQLILPTYTVLALPSANPAGQFVYCSNESGGPVPAFSDGTNWRRVTDRAIVT